MKVSLLMCAALLAAPLAFAAPVHRAAAPGAAPAPATAAAPAGARLRVLSNGLHVVIAPDTTAATVDVSLWFAAGSRDERAGKTGLAQLVNGLMFAGSRHYPPGEHQRLIAREGGSANLFSLSDFASLGETVPPASLGLALELEADRMASATFSASALEAARGTIERSRRDPAAHTAVALGTRRLYEVAFAGHPYRSPAGGTTADLAKLTLEDARAWWRDRYGPDGTWLVLCGRLDPDSAEALVRRTMGAVAKRGGPRPPVPAPAAQTEPRRGNGRLEGAGRVVIIGWRTGAARSSDAAAMSVLDAMLTHRRPSRLESALLADTSRFLAVQSGFDQRRDAGLLFVAALISPLADSADVERRIISAVESAGAPAPSSDDFESALRQVQVETLFSWQTPAGMGAAIGRSAMLTGGADPAAALASVKLMTPETLGQAAARQLIAAHRTVVWMSSGPALAPSTEAPAAAGGERKGGR